MSERFHTSFVTVHSQNKCPSLQCKSAGFTGGVVNDSSMVKVGFGRKNVFARFPCKEFDLVWHVKVSKLAPKSGLLNVMGSVCQYQSSSHVYHHFISAVDSEAPLWCVCPDYIWWIRSRFQSPFSWSMRDSTLVFAGSWAGGVRTRKVEGLGSHWSVQMSMDFPSPTYQR